MDVRQASSGRATAEIRSSDPQRSFPDGAASRSSTSRSPCRPRSSALSTASPGQCTACGCSLSASCHPPSRHQPTKGRARASASRQWSQSNVSWFLPSLDGSRDRYRQLRGPIIRWNDLYTDSQFPRAAFENTNSDGRHQLARPDDPSGLASGGQRCAASGRADPPSRGDSKRAKADVGRGAKHALPQLSRGCRT
jgi:hypothetical protein